MGVNISITPVNVNVIKMMIIATKITIIVTNLPIGKSKATTNRFKMKTIIQTHEIMLTVNKSNESGVNNNIKKIKLKISVGQKWIISE